MDGLNEGKTLEIKEKYDTDSNWVNVAVCVMVFFCAVIFEMSSTTFFKYNVLDLSVNASVRAASYCYYSYYYVSNRCYYYYYYYYYYE